MTSTNASNIADLLWHSAEHDGGATALVDGDDTLSYAEVAARAGGVARHLAGLGFTPGERAAVFLERNTGNVACIFGILAAGGIAIIVNDRSRPRQIEHILADSGASVLLSQPEFLERQPRPLATQARTIDVTGIGAADTRPVPRSASDSAVIMYTSGSTGLPKGVEHTHGSLTAGFTTSAAYLGIAAGDRVAGLLSLSTVYGLNQLMSCVITGATFVLERSPLATDLVQRLREQRVTVAAGVPPLWLQLLEVASFRDHPIESLRQLQNAGGHLPAEVTRRLRAAQPQAGLFLQYGMTEVIRTTFLPPTEVDTRPDCMGRPMPGIDVLVVREDDTPCAVDEVGELVHCGPTIAAGYWNNPDATARVFRPRPDRPGSGERAVYSGDMVRRDKHGYLYFVSRRDRLIKSMGFRVGPDEIGDALHASGQVLEAVVAAEPDPERGQRIVAWVVLKDGGSVMRASRFCRAELPFYMQPSRITPLEKLPRLPSGKYDLDSLRAATPGAG